MIDWRQALLRARYMKALAHIEHEGVPIDIVMLGRLRRHWPAMREQLIKRVDQSYGVFEGTTFTYALFESYLRRRGLAWPMLPTGRLKLDDVTFREQAAAHPELGPLRQLRLALAQMRTMNIAVGPDGRNRVMLSAFRSKTGRNQPSTSSFIFGQASWIRHLIKPPAGFGLAYIDWEQQEFAIAGVLSGDRAMMDSYRSGDPYLDFAKRAGAVPADATKRSHGTIRDQFKTCALAVLYGAGAERIGFNLGLPPIYGRELLRAHKEQYRAYHRWSERVLDHALITGSIRTVFGWQCHVGADANPRSLSNFPMQGNGAEMLRLACCFLTEAGIRVCAPVHDAVLIIAPLDQLEDTVERAQALMAEASAVVLRGFELRTDVKLVRYPDRYEDERGAAMWATVREVLEEVEAALGLSRGDLPRGATGPVAGRDKGCAPTHTRSL